MKALLGSALVNTKKRAERRAFPIRAYCGPNGSGKSALAVYDAMPSLSAGRHVLSTVRLLDFDNPRPCEGYRIADGQMVVCEICARVSDPEGSVYAHAQAHPFWVPFTRWEQLLEAEKCDVIMDEVTGVASSRESHSMPAPVANKLVQCRRSDVTISWTAPNWARADKIIRETSQAVTHMAGYMAVESGDEDRMWKQRRLFRARTYDAALFDEFTEGKRETLAPWVVDWHYGPWSPAFASYDTLDAVLAIGTVSDGGRCFRCGGRRRAPACSCPSDYDVTEPVCVDPVPFVPERDHHDFTHTADLV